MTDIVDDYSAIAHRLAQLQQTPQPFQLPEGVHIVPWHVPYGLLATFEMCFIIRDRYRLRLIKSRTNGFSTFSGIDMISYLAQYFPSIHRVAGIFELEMSLDDMEQLAKFIQALPAA